MIRAASREARCRTAILVCAALLLGPAAPALAATTGGAFPELEPSARTTALGGAWSVLSSGGEALYANPAGLLDLARPEFTASYCDLYGLGALRHSAAQLAWPRLGRHIEWEKGEIRNVSNAPPARSAFGFGLTRLGAEFDSDETYDETQAALGFAWTAPLHFRFGGTYRFLSASSSYENYGASGHALDLGFRRELAGLEFGGFARNLVSHVNWDRGRDEELEPRLHLGVARRLWQRRLVPAVEVAFRGADAELETVGGAVVATPVPALALIGGARRREDANGSQFEWSAGCGLHAGALSADYGLRSHHESLGDTHRFSLRVSL